MRVLAFAASLRRGSLNRKLIALAAELARSEGADVDLADFAEFRMPSFDGDLEEASGLPAGAVALKLRLERVDALLLASPEYNYSIPGPLKNAIDWVSRARPMPWRGKSVYLMSASPSPMGGIRGLWHARVPLEGCGALVFPDMFALANADRAFDASGRFADEKMSERLASELCGFLRLAESVTLLCSAAAPDRDLQRKIHVALEGQSRLQPRAPI